MTDTDKLVQGYSHPIRRARLGQEQWDKIKGILIERLHSEGKDLPEYFEEEEVMDLNRANLQNFEENAKG